jgi:hypothetical protein
MLGAVKVSLSEAVGAISVAAGARQVERRLAIDGLDAIAKF